MTGSMLQSRAVFDPEPRCPAGAPIGETITGSGCLCRITGNVLTSGENPSSLKVFCLNELPMAIGASAEGKAAMHGYQGCPVWRFNRQVELREKEDAKVFVEPQST